jgi:hypothetical protein
MTRLLGNRRISGKISFIRCWNKTGMIGCFVEEPSSRPFFDFIVLYGSPGKGVGRVRKRDWGVGLFCELWVAVRFVVLVFVLSVLLF